MRPLSDRSVGRQEHRTGKVLTLRGDCAENMMGSASIDHDARFGDAGRDHAVEKLVRLVDAADWPETNAIEIDAADTRTRHFYRPQGVDPAFDRDGVVGT